MADEEWGPWVEHDGKGCPVKGQVVQVERRNGCLAGPFVAYSIGPAESEGDAFFDTWLHLPKPNDVLRYRVRKPRGLTILEGILADLPAPTEREPA